MIPQTVDFVKNFLSRDKVEFDSHLDMFYYAFSMPFLKRNRPNGIYLLGDFYVGKSIDYSSRILDHRTGIRSALKGYNTSGRTSADGALSWFQRFNNRSIPVFHMSDDQQDEYIVAQKLIDQGFPIVNDLRQCDGYYDSHMTDKEWNCIKYLAGIGYKIEIPKHRSHLIIPNNETL